MGEIDLGLISIKQTVAILKVNRITVYRLIEQDLIPVYRIGPKYIRLYKDDVIFLRKEVLRIKKKYPFINEDLKRISSIARRSKFPSIAP